jgi:hypothetical protein
VRWPGTHLVFPPKMRARTRLRGGELCGELGVLAAGAPSASTALVAGEIPSPPRASRGTWIAAGRTLGSTRPDLELTIGS